LKYLLDTCAISEITKPQANRGVIEWLESTNSDDLYLSVMENWSLLVANAEKKEQPIASLDSIIAATAYTHHLTLVTRNERDFYACNIPVINPWGL
jgi:predicted nucleic acid-binding protein